MAWGYRFDVKWVCPMGIMPEVFESSIQGGGLKWGGASFLEGFLIFVKIIAKEK